MDLQHLQNFLTILEQRSISNAASLIHIAQPALSRQVKALEAEVGGPLLVRHPWGVSPTAAGEVLAARAREILHQVQEARAEIGAIADTPLGALSIGVSASIASLVLPPLARLARIEMPRVRLKLCEASGVALQQRVLSRELDLALMHVRGPAQALETKLVLTEPVVAAGPAGLFRPEEPVRMKQILRRDLLVTSSTGRLRLLYEEAMARAAVAHPAFVEIDSFPSLIELLAAGQGVALLPYSTLHAGVRAGRLSWAPIAPRPLTRTLILARLGDRLETPALRIAARLLRQVIEDQGPTLGWSVEPAAARTRRAAG
jgi:LysR family nitrogen assimilation transcriptional regulator